MAHINFLGGLCPEYDSFFCKCIPGGPDCSKCLLMAFCSNRRKGLRCTEWGTEHDIKLPCLQDSLILQGKQGV